MNSGKIFFAISTIVLASGILVFSGGTAEAAMYYVDATRPNDDGDGKSWSAAEKTIEAGISHLSSGDTLKIKTGIYAESINISGKNFTDETRIETDDGAGNPGVVTITGTAGNPARVISTSNAGNLAIDGRQSITEGDASYGFILSPASSALGIYVNEYSANDTIKLFRIKSEGIKPGGDYGTFNLLYAGAYEVAYCSLEQMGGNEGDVLIVNGEYSPGPYATSVKIHHNYLTGNPSNGYGVITSKRNIGHDIHSNYIYNAGNGAVGIILRDAQFAGGDGSEAGDVYNNVIYESSGNMRTGVQIRGMTNGDGGGTDNLKIYNNTLEGSFSDAPFMINDDSDNNHIFNNLIIGNTSYFVEGWGDTEGRGNILSDNVATGSVSNWARYSVMFSETATNYSGQGTSFIKFSGERPSFYYGLKESKNGIGTLPDTDFAGNARLDPPDVGAFEYSAGGGDTTPPGSPVNLTVR